MSQEKSVVHTAINDQLCRKCSAKMRIGADFCPRCGHDNRAYSNTWKAAWLGVVLAPVYLLPAIRWYCRVNAVLVAPAVVAEAPAPKRLAPPIYYKPYTAPPDAPQASRLQPAEPESGAAPTAPPIDSVMVRTSMLGGRIGGGPFEKIGVADEPLLGFRIQVEHWFGKTIIRTLEPVFPSDQEVVTHSMVVAREGYAVGGIYFNGDQHVTAMRILFMRILPHGLSTTDTYQSGWFGEPTEADTFLLGGRGHKVIGIFGRNGMNVDALGLVLLQERMPERAAEPPPIGKKPPGGVPVQPRA